MAGYHVYGKGEYTKKLLCDVVHINWFEDLTNVKNPFGEYIKRKLFIFFMKLIGKRIVYTAHNRRPHDMNDQYSIKLMRYILKKSNSILIHSQSSRQIICEDYGMHISDKIIYVPHPNYIGIYNDSKEYMLEGLNYNHLKVAFLGQVRPYKNVEVLINAANLCIGKEIDFIICGSCIDDEYREQIERIKKNERIFTDFRFIEDEEICSLFSKIDILVLPYNTESSLNSGAAILAMSFGKNIISTETCTIIDMKEKNGIYYYNYISDREEHTKRLFQCIDEIYTKWVANAEKVKKDGEELFEYVKRENSLEIVSENLRKVYS